jgi:hypothetical protein
MLPVFKSQTRSFKGRFIGKKRRKWNENWKEQYERSIEINGKTSFLN